MGVLTVNIDQELADFTELLHGRRRTVDPGARTTADIHQPAQQQFFFALEAVFIQPEPYFGQAGDFESRRNFCPFTTGSNNARIAPLTISAAGLAQLGFQPVAGGVQALGWRLQLGQFVVYGLVDALFQ